MSAFSPAKGRVSQNGQWGWGGQSRGLGFSMAGSPLQRVDKLVLLGCLWGTHRSWEVGVRKKSLEDIGPSSKKACMCHYTVSHLPHKPPKDPSS